MAARKRQPDEPPEPEAHGAPADGDHEREAGVAEAIKRLAYLGVGTLFMTQETASKAVRELRLPRDVAEALLRQVDRSKDDLVRAVKSVLREFLSDIDPVELLRRALDGVELEVSAKVKMGEPKTGNGARVRRKRSTRGRKRDEAQDA